MKTAEHRIRAIAAATAGVSFALPAVYAIHYPNFIQRGSWKYLLFWIVVVLIAIRPLIRRLRGPLPSSRAPWEAGEPLPDSDGAMAPWGWVPLMNIVFGISFIPPRSGNTPFVWTEFALIAVSIALVGMGKGLEKALYERRAGPERR